MHCRARLPWVLGSLLTAYLAGCSPEVVVHASSGSATTGLGMGATGSAGAGPPLSLQGRVRSASSALGGASISVYAVTTDSSQPAQPLAQGQSSDLGEFQLSVVCPSNSATSPLIYLIATGGAAQFQSASGGQQPSNAAIRLMAVLGTCGALPSAVTINELTTIAADYALNAFIDGDAIGGGAPGLPNAAATAAQLVDASTGALAASLPAAATCSADAPPLNCETVRKLSALANAIAACNASAASSAPPCATFLSCATSGARDGGAGPCSVPAGAVSPKNTSEAILTIARSPGLVSASGLFRAAAASTAYSPVPAAAPNDWTLSLNYTGGGISEPTALAVDAIGNVWIANYNSAVTQLSASGSALSPAGGYTGGGLEESFGIAIDATGHVWVCNEQSTATFNSGLGSITELAADGTVMSGTSGFGGGGLDFPQSLALDTEGHVWVSNFGNSTLTELTSDGAPMSPEMGFTGGGLSFPIGLAIDANGDLWAANQGADRISAFSAAGTPLSPAAGYTGGGLAVPQGIAVDQKNNVWVSNYFGGSVSEFSAEGVPVSPVTGYGGGGLATPGGIAIDGAGHVWVANYEARSLSELAGAGDPVPGSALSPAAGFTASSLLQPFALAVDPSGNVWVSNFGNDSVTEFIGIAVPVATPLIGVPRSP